MAKPKTKSEDVLFKGPDEEVEATTVSDQGLDDMKIQRAQDIVKVVARLCSEGKRKDSPAIIQSVVDDMDQLFLIGQETGRRLERDSIARKVPR